MAFSIKYVDKFVNFFVKICCQINSRCKRFILELSFQFRHLTQQNFKTFSANIPLLYPLKLSENRRFSDVFKGYRNKTLNGNGSMKAVALV